MFLSLALIFGIGVIGGFLFEKIRMPKLIWYLILGILLGPSVFNIIDPKLMEISSYLRQIALVIILTRSGLSLDFATLKKIGRPAFLMCFIPACFEITGITIFAPIFLDVSIFESLLLGSVLAAVSPAIVVPRMIKLQEEGYGKAHNVPELIMAGSSCDDIFVIVLFYGFKELVSTNNFDSLAIINIPVSIILGIAIGLICGLLLGLLIKKINVSNPIRICFLLGVSFSLLYLEEALKQWVNISSLLSIIVLAMCVAKLNKEKKKEIQSGYNNLWAGFEILLFSLVGALTDLNYAFSKEGAILLGIILIALIFRSVGVILCLCFTKYSVKEKLFIVISYLPKATVQASIGGIALAEGLQCGTLILTASIIAIVLTAPLGAILMDFTYKKLLKKEDESPREISKI